MCVHFFALLTVNAIPSTAGIHLACVIVALMECT